MCARFRLIVFRTCTKTEVNEAKEREKKNGTHQHRIIASLVANQQQEKYENIKKCEVKKIERICLETV